MKRKLHTMIATLLIAGLAVGCGKSAAQKKAEKEQKITDVFEGAEAKECETKAKAIKDAIEKIADSITSSIPEVQKELQKTKDNLMDNLNDAMKKIKKLEEKLKEGHQPTPKEREAVLEMTKFTKEQFKTIATLSTTAFLCDLNKALTDNALPPVLKVVVDEYINATTEMLLVVVQLTKKAIEIE